MGVGFMSLIACIKRICRGKRIVAKNAPRKGKSARNGNAPAPYTKYHKRPYIYAWQRSNRNWADEKQDYEHHKKAA